MKPNARTAADGRRELPADEVALAIAISCEVCEADVVHHCIHPFESTSGLLKRPRFVHLCRYFAAIQGGWFLETN
jgi:hypothetical protein